MEIDIKIEPSTRHVKVPVSVNGEGPFTFDLDTGASRTTLTKKLAQQLGIQTRKGDGPDARGIGGGIPTEFANARISLGSLQFDEDEVYVLDLDAILRGVGNRDGVLGYSTLKHCTMTLSYVNQRLELIKGNSTSVDDWAQFEYIKDSHLIGVPVHINGKGPYDFVLDTGAGNTTVTPEIASELGLNPQPIHGIVRGLGGDTQLELAAVDSLSVGTAGISQGQVVVLDMKKVSPKGKLIENGIIGYDFLHKFDTIIDYPQKQFSFVKTRNQ